MFARRQELLSEDREDRKKKRKSTLNRFKMLVLLVSYTKSLLEDLHRLLT